MALGMDKPVRPRFRGGYRVLLDGRPSGRVETLPEPEELILPLRSRRFAFTEPLVEDGQRVEPGFPLAKDPRNYSVPLLAPRAGKVRLEPDASRILLEDVTCAPEEPYHPGEDLLHIPRDVRSVSMRRYKLLALGAWQFFYDAHTGGLPDPFGTPAAVIVSTLHLEPFLARGDVQIKKRLGHFTRGLEHLQSLLEYQPIYLVMPDVESGLAERVRDMVRGYAFVKIVEVPRRYPLDHLAVLARGLGLRREEGRPVWGVGPAGVLAVDRALTLSRPSTVRIISLGGPGVREPVHLKAMPGYPLEAILRGRTTSERVRVLSGGVLTGEAVSPEGTGLDAECQGLTVLEEHEGREFLGFMRPGLDRRSYSNCFLGALRPRRRERLTTALRGERRACVACNFCEEVCPAGIMPHLIHKYLYQDALEEAERARVDLCVDCGLCSFVCPSKIELAAEMRQARDAIRRELHAGEDGA